MSETELIKAYKEKVTRIQYHIYHTLDKAVMEIFERKQKSSSIFTVEEAYKQIKWFENNELFKCVELSSDGRSEKRVYMPFNQVSAFEMVDK